MTEPESHPEAPRHPGRHRGSHAAPSSPLRLLVRSLLAVAIVAGVVAALLEWRGSPTTSTEAPPGPAIISPTPGPSLSATATPSPASTITVKPPPPRPPRPHPSATTPTRVVAPLLVLNNTREVGKAHRAAAKFRAGGWPVSGTGNYRVRRLSSTTVYYVPGDARSLAAAESLRRQYPAVATVAARISGLPGHGLTVVLTANFPA